MDDHKKTQLVRVHLLAHKPEAPLELLGGKVPSAHHLTPKASISISRFSKAKPATRMAVTTGPGSG